MKTRGLKSFWGVVCLYGVGGWGVTAVLYAGSLLGAVGSHYWGRLRAMWPALYRSMTYNPFPKTQEFSTAKIPCGGGGKERKNSEGGASRANPP